VGSDVKVAAPSARGPRRNLDGEDQKQKYNKWHTAHGKRVSVSGLVMTIKKEYRSNYSEPNPKRARANKKFRAAARFRTREDKKESEPGIDKQKKGREKDHQGRRSWSSVGHGRTNRGARQKGKVRSLAGRDDAGITPQAVKNASKKTGVDTSRVENMSNA